MNGTSRDMSSQSFTVKTKTSNGDSTSSTTNEGHHDRHDPAPEEDLEWLPAHTDPNLIRISSTRTCTHGDENQG